MSGFFLIRINCLVQIGPERAAARGMAETADSLLSCLPDTATETLIVALGAPFESPPETIFVFIETKSKIELPGQARYGSTAHIDIGFLPLAR